MNIRKAVHAGYCWGVERALDIVTDTAAAHPGERMRTLGPIIHNPHVVRSLEEKGVQSVHGIDEMTSGDTVIIRTHGVSPETYEQAKVQGLNIVDATCPLVTLVQNKAKQLVQEGYHLVIFGNPRHPEIIGTIGHAGGNATVIESPEDIAKVSFPKRVGVVVQTTQEIELLASFLAKLAPRCKELKIFNTICNPTIERQEAARELAREVEVVIVVGGKNSSNTRHLAEVCREAGAVAHHIEDASELDPTWVEGRANVGVTAGASTPGWLMDQVIERLQAIGEAA
jgi:4-hydroxy-3-methylbut-2-enyl diphosphate reductase